MPVVEAHPGHELGLVSTTDGGATWTWACEVPASNNASLYQVGAAPGRRLFALSTAQRTNDRRLIFTDDRACGWRVSGGMLASALVLDAFPDPSDPQTKTSPAWRARSCA